MSKRLFDIVLSILLIAVLAIPMLCIALWLAISQGRAVLYGAERMKSPQRAFVLWKFRTMTPVEVDSGVSGGDKSGRITPQGAILRRFRIDELPQLWNVLKGDISFVGPRPPMRQYVEAHPELYARVLASKPGITGLASLRYASYEERLLAKAQTAEETDTLYQARCVPAKAKLDLIYQQHASLCYDIRLIWDTARRFLPYWLGKRGKE